MLLVVHIACSRTSRHCMVMFCYDLFVYDFCDRLDVSSFDSNPGAHTMLVYVRFLAMVCFHFVVAFPLLRPGIARVTCVGVSYVYRRRVVAGLE